MHNKYTPLFMWLITGLISLSLFPQAVIAGDAMSRIDATFNGELIEIPCKFATATDLDFDFKDVIAQEVDDKSHYVDKPISVTCDARSPTQLLTLRITGTALAGSAKNVLDSNLANMGIELTNAESGKELNLNEALGKDATDVVDNTLSFKIRAALMNNKPGSTVITGDFSANLTISAKFE